MKNEINKAAINEKYCQHWNNCQHHRCMVINDCTNSFFYDPVGKQRPDRMRVRNKAV